jgi:hypothetical protein
VRCEKGGAPGTGCGGGGRGLVWEGGGAGLPDGCDHGRITQNRHSTVDKTKLGFDYKESAV